MKSVDAEAAKALITAKQQAIVDAQKAVEDMQARIPIMDLEIEVLTTNKIAF